VLETSTPGLRRRELESGGRQTGIVAWTPSSEVAHATVARNCVPEVLRQLLTLPTCYHPLLLFNREGDSVSGEAAAGERPQR
jgi:hypothetical protein